MYENTFSNLRIRELSAANVLHSPNNALSFNDALPSISLLVMVNFR